MRLNTVVSAWLITTVFLVTGTAQAALVDTLYVTDGDSARLAIVTGNGPATIKSTFVRGYPLAVRNSIWIGDYRGDSPVSREYDLAGNATGNTSPYTSIFAVDGAVNGNINYALGNAFNSTATIYQANTDWTGQVAIFSVSGSDLVGITFDSVFGTLWISDQNRIYQYTTTGTLLGSFAHLSGRGSLAYETSTDTLWYVRNGSNFIDQYSKTGALLQSLNISGLASNNWGAEFATPAQNSVPEPATLTMFGLTVLGYAGVALRRRKQAE